MGARRRCPAAAPPSSAAGAARPRTARRGERARAALPARARAVLAVFFQLALRAQPAGGQTRLLKLVAEDGKKGDKFGTSVAVSSDGARVVVGSPDNDDKGDDSGSVSVFDGATGERLDKPGAEDGKANDFFGISVAVSSDGARVVVGALHGGDDKEENSRGVSVYFGSVSVFDGATGERLELVAEDGGAYDRFGDQVAVSSDGARVVVGAHNDDDKGQYSGSVSVFDGATGERLFKLVAEDGGAYDKFGTSVAVSSDGARVVVGAHGDRDKGSASGSVSVFDGATGERLLKLVAEDGETGDRFGHSVAMSSDGARVVVGAHHDEDKGQYSGSVSVFDGATGERLFKLVAEDGGAGDSFGTSVAVSSDGARVVVGSMGRISRSVSVFDGATGERLFKLVAEDGEAYDRFGISVAVSSDGARVVVGAYYDDDKGRNSGSVHVFDGGVLASTTASPDQTTTTPRPHDHDHDHPGQTTTASGSNTWYYAAGALALAVSVLALAVALARRSPRVEEQSPMLTPESETKDAGVRDQDPS